MSKQNKIRNKYANESLKDNSQAFNDYKDFNDRDYFFTYNGNGHMISFSSEDDKNSPIDYDELAQWVIDNDKIEEFNIDVITSDDMYNAILDNLEDSSSLDDVLSVAEILNLAFSFDEYNDSPADYESHIINTIMDTVYENKGLLLKVIKHMKIDI